MTSEVTTSPCFCHILLCSSAARHSAVGLLFFVTLRHTVWRLCIMGVWCGHGMCFVEEGGSDGNAYSGNGWKRNESGNSWTFCASCLLFELLTEAVDCGWEGLAWKINCGMRRRLRTGR